MKRRAFVLLLAAVPMWPQSFAGTASFSGQTPFSPPAITGAPYSADEVNEQVQTLLDGTHIRHKAVMRRVYRDALGRTRSERPLITGPKIENPPMIVEIMDPVAGYQYTLDTDKKIAHRVKLAPPLAPGSRAVFSQTTTATTMIRSGSITSVATPAPVPPPPPPGAVAPSAPTGYATSGTQPVPAPGAAVQHGKVGRLTADSADTPRPDFKNEDLGTQMMNGIMAQGHRTTTTFPAGSQDNDQPIVVVTESWFSPELKLSLLSKTSDPRRGESTYRLENLSRIDPDPMLFQVPADYTIVDETGPFSIQYSR